MEWLWDFFLSKQLQDRSYFDIIPDTGSKLDGDDPVIPVDVDMDMVLGYELWVCTWCFVEIRNFWIEPTDHSGGH